MTGGAQCVPPSSGLNRVNQLPVSNQLFVVCEFSFRLICLPPLPFPSAERSISRPHPLPAGGGWPSQVVKCRCSLSLPGEVYHMPGGQYTKFWFILFSDIFGNIGNGIRIFSVIWYIWKYGREFFGNQCCTSGRALFLDRSHRCQGLLWTSLNFFDYQHWLIIIDYLWVSLIICSFPW